ncbi:MAG: hypothetical protein RLZZ537_1442, partial [Pseudomonadota bacterium]
MSRARAFNPNRIKPINDRAALSVVSAIPRNRKIVLVDA